MIDAAVKTALLLALVAIIALLSRRASASFRHLMWALGLTCTLCLPLLSQNLPHWRVPVTVLPTHSRPAAEEAPLADTPLADTPQPEPPTYAPVEPRTKATVPAVATLPRGVVEPTAAVQPPTPTPMPDLTEPSPAASAPQLPWTTLVLVIWLGGAVLMLVQLAQGVLKVRRIVTASAIPVFGPIAGAAAEAMSVGRHVTLRLASSPGRVTVPFTYGLLRPVIVLPAETAQWPEERLRAALLHEMAHVRRHDWLLQVMAHIVRALYWFNPLVWLAVRRLRAESEAAADDLVLGVGMPAPEYARHLLDVALSARQSRRISQGAVAMAQSPKVEERLRAVLALGSSRRPLTRRRTLGACSIAALLTLPMAAIRLTPSAHAQATLPGRMTAISWPPTRAGAAPSHRASDLSAVAGGGVAVLPGSRAVFPNGYEVSLVAVTRAVRTGDQWDMFGGPWWRPDGTFIAPQSGGLDGHWHWSTAHTHGLPPFVFKVAFRAPASVWRHGDSSSPGFYEQFLGALKPDDQAVEGHIVISGLHPTVRHIISSLVDGSAPQRFGGAVGGTRCVEIYPTGTRTCTVRCGVAAGPWHAVSRHPFTLTPSSVTTEAFVDSVLSSTAHGFTDVSLTLDDRPRETYLDARGKRHVFYFLGATGRLGNVARRFVAVDRAGRVIPLNEVGTQRVDLAFGNQSDVSKWNPTLDLARVKEFRLQTCPYLTAEFQNVQLQPAMAAGGVQDAEATLLAQAGTAQLEQARQLRAHLQGWAESNRALLQRMARAQPDDLAALIAVYDSLQRLPFPLWDGDPRLGHGSEDASFSIAMPSRLTLTHLQRSQDSVETRMRRDFTQFHDLAVAQSVNVGRSHITLWSSGRITRTTTRDDFMEQGKPIRTEEIEQEMVHSFFGGGASGMAVDTTSTAIGRRPHQESQKLPSISTVRAITSMVSTPLIPSRKPILADAAKSPPAQTTIRTGAPSLGMSDRNAAANLAQPQPTRVDTDAGVTAAQEQLRRVTVGYTAGVNSRGEVNVAATALAEVRIRSAAAQNEFTGLGPDLEAVVRNKQELLEETQTRFRAGASDTTTVNRAEEAVAEARVRADLYAVLKARQSALSEIKALYRSGATSTQEVDKATAALQKAQHAFISRGSE